MLPEEIEKKSREISYDYYSLLSVATEILRSIPRYQKIVLTDKSSREQYIGKIKKITNWEVEFVEDSTRNCYMFSVKNLVFDSIYYLGEDQDVYISVRCFEEQKERKNNAKNKR